MVMQLGRPVVEQSTQCLAHPVAWTLSTSLKLRVASSIHQRTLTNAQSSFESAQRTGALMGLQGAGHTCTGTGHEGGGRGEGGAHDGEGKGTWGAGTLRASSLRRSRPFMMMKGSHVLRVVRTDMLPSTCEHTVRHHFLPKTLAPTSQPGLLV